MKEIIPAILADNGETFTLQLKAVENDCKTVQVDALDNTLFPNKNWFDPKVIGEIQTNVEFELHLMMENPIPTIESWKHYVPNFKRAIVHAEMNRPLGTITAYIKDVLKLEVGVAINPETPLSAIESVIHSIDQLTIMSVHPGFQGQKFGDQEHMGSSDSILEKIKHAKAHCPELKIEIDGGLTKDLIEPLLKAGASKLCAGSLIFKSDSPTLALGKLNEIIKNYE